MTTSDDAMDLTAIRARLAGSRGPTYWRSLEELAGTPAFQEFLGREFPSQASEWGDPLGRRRFLRLMAASLALAGVGTATGCAFQPPETIVPYVQAPEEVVPGRPLFFASALTLGGFATGVLVESHQGRPTKIEGNELHPASLGGTDALTQAALLTFYDPDRSQAVIHNGRVSTWDEFQAVALDARAACRSRHGAGLRILTETITSPTLAAQLERLLAELPEAQWHQHEPVGRDPARLGARLALGEDVATIHHFDKADVVLALDADFLAWGPARVRDARAFAARREVTAASPRMNRLYVVECTPSITGAMADHRLPVAARRVFAVAHAVARALAIDCATALDSVDPMKADPWIAAVARDLQAHRGAGLVIAGDAQPAAVHALAHALNHALGNVGATVEYRAPVEARPIDQGESLRALTRDIDAGKVDTLVILGGNPVYDAPADLDFAARLKTVPLRLHLGLYHDETAELCQWHVPEAHWLEAWGDARAFDGTVSIQQPLIAPLFGGKSALEMLAVWLGRPNQAGLSIVRDTWKDRKLPGDFEGAWRQALHDGLIADTAAPLKTTEMKRISIPAPSEEATGLELVFRPDPTIWDGRFANNGWLQELPKPLTKLTWDNAALIAPKTAERLKLKNEDVVELGYRGRSLRAPVWIAPGHAEESVTVHLGYGRTRAGRVGNDAGRNAYALRTSDAPWFGTGLTITPTGARHALATTQHHQNMEGRDLVRAATREQFQANPRFATGREHEKPPGPALTLYNPAEHASSGHAWGMAINLNTCIGCNACVVACQAENNIPVVGKEEVLRGREMHWIRVDRYYKNDGAADPLANPETYHQPVPCMHCENAPCELVCPVAATNHDAEGLNVMVYNRCVGTRYCSNNCPYKVRRFNFLQYSDETTESLKLMRNPDVTVRTRGVMEKCTYCTQRITAARIQAEQEGRTIRDGEFQTACQAACPTRAIVFGDVHDPASAVSKAKADARNYGLLAELNTRPRTTYLAKLTNPNPELTGG